MLVPYEDMDDEDIEGGILIKEFDLEVSKLKGKKAPVIDDMPSQQNTRRSHQECSILISM